MSDLPECALEDCRQRPEVRVELDAWFRPKKLCEEHAEWARDAHNAEVLD